MGGNMIKYLTPDHYYKNILSINFKKLKESGIQGIICDIDNTIVPYQKKIIIDEILELFANLKEMGFEICLISNGLNKRVQFFSKKLDIPAFGRAVKPRKKAYKKAMSVLKLDQEQIAVIGDQIFTDILGGNRLGFETILVNPMEEKEFIITKIIRMVEKLIFTRKEDDTN